MKPFWNLMMMLVAVAALTLTGCQPSEPGPAEEAGKEMDKAVEEADSEGAFEKMGKDMDKAAKDAGNEMEKAGEEIEKAAEDAGDSINNAIDEMQGQ